MPLAAEMAGFLAHTAEAVATVLRAAHPDTSGVGHREVLDVSLEAMPYLRDHCLMRQRPGWPQEEDLRPVVPATTMVTHMIEAAERAFPGLVAVAVEDIRSTGGSWPRRLGASRSRSSTEVPGARTSGSASTPREPCSWARDARRHRRARGAPGWASGSPS
jgi:hypothetical protein